MGIVYTLELRVHKTYALIILERFGPRSDSVKIKYVLKLSYAPTVLTVIFLKIEVLNIHL